MEDEEEEEEQEENDKEKNEKESNKDENEGKQCNLEQKLKTNLETGVKIENRKNENIINEEKNKIIDIL
jgi:hypothetical protein